MKRAFAIFAAAFLLALALCPLVYGDTKVWFSPQGGCEGAIVERIESARASIKYQMYNFTSANIADALERAAKRGVTVTIILDRVAAAQKGCKAIDCAAAGCQVFIDGKHKIAHNKVRIFDDKIVMGGSFNDTESAETKNAENLIWCNDEKTVAQYVENFDKHLKHSEAWRPAK